MNMPIAEINRRQEQTQAFAALQVMPVANITEQSDASRLDTYLSPSEMLDHRFALQNGSHKDVKQYLVYFNHLMAFFVDGSHCGLKQASQFVAYAGQKELPESIVLKENNVHIEVILNTAKGAEDIKIELVSQDTFTAPSGEDYVVE
ncbi:malate synthase [Glaciecola punicea ACAM 611]|jgi:malate synthase|uniref:Malate synthase n=1 Tax=Glaciecola punicea ACAM 611 TaxID=1121923 RepID=H5TC20_9ALTE|nr:hypothetical protein [Glaciecola punicea]OFA32084.1 malate synthase [Glaciecola punicea]GAB55847.1 malate synthase [Glaciecola punicea ACAM 611]